MLPPASAWNAAIASLPAVSDPAVGMANFAAAVAGVCANMDVQGNTGTPSVFTFEESTFSSELGALGPTSDPVAGTMGFSDAWGTAVQASTFEVQPGASISGASFASVATSEIDPGSISAEKPSLASTLASLPAVSDPSDSGFGAAFRDAFLALTVSAAGQTPGGDPVAISNVPTQ